jgi:hypothetical protein
MTNIFLTLDLASFNVLKKLKVVFVGNFLDDSANNQIIKLIQASE